MATCTRGGAWRETASPDPQSPIIDLTMGKKAATYGAVVKELLADTSNR